ncbi:MAG: AAA family ATPase [Chloroflexi bacterium]|nr:MAG: AAA family ATPase [Chloroflexota bacterium]
MERLEALLRAQQAVQRTAITAPLSRSSAAAEPPAPVCEWCEGARFVRVTSDPESPEFGRAVPCRCVQEEDGRTRRERLLRYARLGALERFTFATLLPRGRSTRPEAQARYALAVDAARRFADAPQGWLVLTGVPGSGKTHMAAAIVNQVVEAGRPALFFTVADLLDQLRASYNDDAELSYDRLFDQIRNAPLLVLDDLDSYSDTAWAREKFDQLVSHRFHAALPTVFTCDRSPEEIDARLGARLTDPALAQVFFVAGRELPRYMHVGGMTRERLASFTFETFRTGGKSVQGRAPGLEGAAREARRWAADPQGWLVFLGESGRGKTHLAGAIANHRLEAGDTVCFANVPDLLDELRAAFAPDAHERFEDLLQRLRDVPVLILDDLGAQQTTPWAQEKLYQILNYRYEGRMPTVVTTNTEMSRLDPRLASRLGDLQISVMYEIVAPDYRLG